MSEHVRDVIAVVDDDASILESLEDLLQSAGYEVRLYSCGSALLASDISSIDCLITDVGMPTMDGFELRDRVTRARPKLPVILISGQRDLAIEPQLDSQGYTAFFRKPFDGRALLAAVGDALRVAHG